MNTKNEFAFNVLFLSNHSCPLSLENQDSICRKKCYEKELFRKIEAKISSDYNLIAISITLTLREDSMNKYFMLISLLSLTPMHSDAVGPFEELGRLFDEMTELSQKSFAPLEESKPSFTIKDGDDSVIITFENIEGENIKGDKSSKGLTITTDTNKIDIAVHNGNISVIATSHVIQAEDRDEKDKGSFRNEWYSESSRIMPIKEKLNLDLILKNSKQYLKFDRKAKTLTITIPKEAIANQNLEIDIVEEQEDEQASSGEQEKN